MPTFYPPEKLLIHPEGSPNPEIINEIHPEQAGWDTLHFQAHRFSPGFRWSFDTGENELALIVLEGKLAVDSNRGRWESIGGRRSVFTGLPYALYLPRQTEFTVTALTQAEFAAAWVATSLDFQPRLVTPKDVWVEIRGGDHATRQIHSMLPPGFPCARLVVVEVYTPGGNWSSYPPHKHDRHIIAPDGALLEADLDEIYYYRMDRPEGYAIQRVYTGADSPLQRAGSPIDATLTAYHNDIILIPEGYHPVSTPPGYNAYYLNILAGSAQSLAASDDPAYAWVKNTYQSRDPRVPLFDISGAAGVR